MARPKIVVVGAGPAGSACALALQLRGSAEVLLLDKSTYPRVKVCGSGLSPKALSVLEQLGVRERFASGAIQMPKMLAKGPGGQEVLLSGRKGAWVVPRITFDQGLVDAAIEHGARFQQGVKVTGLARDPSGRVRGVQVGDDVIDADLVISATGSPSRFATDESPQYAIRTIMGWWRGASLAPDTGMMIWDRRLDGYYAWAFPEPDSVVNIGITIPEHAAGAKQLKDLFRELLDEHFAAVVRGAEPIGKWMGHPAILTTKIGDHVAEEGLLYVGEAARLVCPATVEGISFAMESGVIAADVVTKHWDRVGGLSRVGRALYRTRLAARMLPKFWAGEAFVKLMRSDRARALTSRAIDVQWLASKATALVGEQPV